jgi:gamma-glutamylcysteine synthetase
MLLTAATAAAGTAAATNAVRVDGMAAVTTAAAVAATTTGLLPQPAALDTAMLLPPAMRTAEDARTRVTTIALTARSR